MAAKQDGDAVEILVREMGFPRAEAAMAISQCNANIELAVEKLLTGEFAPPPYAEVDKDRTTESAPLPSPVVSPNNVDFDFKPLKQDSMQPNFKADSNPPPYSKICLQNELNDWELKSSADFFQLGSSYSRSGGVSIARCSSCFDEIYENEKAGLTNKSVKDGIRNYHYDCYMKSRGPKCSHCCFPLSKPDLDKNLSGKFLIYNGNKYHVECYEKYAGPRCSYCFNVIIETPNQEFTGQWIGEGHKMFHEECFYKKKYSDERAKYS